jgi:hypothetical protein
VFSAIVLLDESAAVSTTILEARCDDHIGRSMGREIFFKIQLEIF